MGRTRINTEQTSRPLTEEEEAEEIINRLKAPPRRFTAVDLEEGIISEMVQAMADEIDREIILAIKTKLNNLWDSK